MSRILQRELFETTHQLEYFSEKELSMQLGAPPARWGVVPIKELIDTALDACETARIAPEIHVTLTPDGLTVADNGPGMPPALIERSLDYDIRVRDKTYYVSPSRGQLGVVGQFGVNIGRDKRPLIFRHVKWGLTSVSREKQGGPQLGCRKRIWG